MSIVCRPQIVIPMMPGPPAQCRPAVPAGHPTSRARRFPVERADGRCAFDWKPARSRKTARPSPGQGAVAAVRAVGGSPIGSSGCMSCRQILERGFQCATRSSWLHAF